MKQFLGLAVLLCVGSWTCLQGADDPADTSETRVSTAAEAYQSANTIDFGTVLELGFPSLKTLGARIEEARIEHDPVALANLARELGVAEQVSGKQAEITSQQLMESAIELARMRADASELQALALIVDDEATRADLLKDAGAAVEAAELAKAARDQDEQSKGIFNQLIVDNEWSDGVHVYYNGRELGYVPPYGHVHFHLHDHSHFFNLEGYDHQGHSWYSHVHGDYNDFYWILEDPHGHHHHP